MKWREGRIKADGAIHWVRGLEEGWEEGWREKLCSCSGPATWAVQVDVLAGATPCGSGPSCGSELPHLDVHGEILLLWHLSGGESGLWKILNFFFFFFLATPHGLQNLNSLTRGLNLGLWQWNHRVLTTDLPGNSQENSLLSLLFAVCFPLI